MLGHHENAPSDHRLPVRRILGVCRGKGAPAAHGDSALLSNQVSKITGAGRLDLAKALVTGKVTIVNFYADWCGPCRRLEPRLLDMIRSDPEVYLCKVDIQKWGSPVAEQFGLSSIPHIRVYGRDGKQVGEASSREITIRGNVQAAKDAKPASAP